MDIARNKVTIVFLSIFIFLPLIAQGKPTFEQFASLPDVERIKLSPNGNYVASFVRVSTKKQNGVGIQVIDLSNGKPWFVAFAEDKDYKLTNFQWANNEKLLLSAAFPANRYGIDTKEYRLLIVDIHTKESRNAIPKKVMANIGYIPQIQTNIVDLLPEDDEHFLLSIDDHQNIYESVYKVSLNKKRAKRIQSWKKGSFDWITDRKGNVRIGMIRDETKYSIIHRPINEKKWQPLWEFEAFSREKIWPMGFGNNPNELYVTTLHNGKDAIFKVMLDDPNLTKELVHSNPNYDVDGTIIYSQKSKQVVGLKTDIQEHVFWDPSLEALRKGLNKALPDTFNHIVSMSEDENRYILFTTKSDQPGTYYFGDRSQKSLTPMAKRYERLSPEMLAEKQRITYKARDGLEIEAYLTLPKNSKKKSNLPTIIFPHGGPISHDGSGFDYWTQFFQNKGYAVLQMNFRGSSGYGFDFMREGIKNWGKAMQTDIEDGTKWMIEQGYSDQDNICIVGASYGGYAALMGAALTPDLYKCVVSFAGVSDLPKLVKSKWAYTSYELAKEQFGTDYRDMKKRSPYFLAEKITAPVLLIHGEKDRVVNIDQSKKMRKSLKLKDKDVKFVKLKDGTHFLNIQNNRLTTFREMDTFLSKHLAY